MERLTKNNSNMEIEVYKCLIENQIEFFYYDDEEFRNSIDAMTKEEYEKFVDDVVEEFLNDDVMWEVIDEHIKENLDSHLI